MRKVIVNTVSLSAGFAVAQALTVFSYVVTARYLSPPQFGEVAAYTGVAMLIVVVGDFGFNAWVIRELARSGSDVVFATSVGVRSAIALTAGSAWISVTSVMALAGLIPWYVLVLGIWIGFALLWGTLLAPLQASERMHQVAAVTATERLVLLVVVSIGAVTGAAAVLFVTGLAVGGMAAAALAAALIDPSMRRVTWPTLREIGGALRSSLGFAMSSLAIHVQRLDVAIVGLIAGSFSAGIYAAPARLTGALGILPTAFATSLFPNAAKQSGALWTREFIRSLGVILTVMLVLITPLFVFANTLASEVLGHDYRSSGGVLRVVLIGMLLASFNQPIATTYQARGLEHFVAKAVAVGSTFGLAAIAVGASIDGATGAAFGFITHQVAVLVVLLTQPPRLEPHASANGAVRDQTQI
jgi:O-antigen/teichoic acid export membrane protein